jgi:hypothetical protein
MNRLERWSVVVGSFLVTASGLVYLWMKYLLQSPDPFSVVNHPWQPAVLKLHILTAPLLVFGLGLIAVRHVLAHWLAGVSHARRSGIAAALTVLPMVLSGYLVQAITDARWLSITTWVHVGASLVYGAAFALHQFLVRGRRRAPAAQPSAPFRGTTPRASSAARAAWKPPMPWTPPPGGVDAEQR